MVDNHGDCCCPLRIGVVGPLPNGLYKWLINRGYTPSRRKINGWNLRIRAPWKWKIIFQIIHFQVPAVNLRGVILLLHPGMILHPSKPTTFLQVPQVFPPSARWDQRHGILRLNPRRLWTRGNPGRSRSSKSVRVGKVVMGLVYIQKCCFWVGLWISWFQKRCQPKNICAQRVLHRLKSSYTNPKVSMVYVVVDSMPKVSSHQSKYVIPSKPIVWQGIDTSFQWCRIWSAINTIEYSQG